MWLLPAALYLVLFLAALSACCSICYCLRKICKTHSKTSVSRSNEFNIINSRDRLACSQSSQLLLTSCYSTNNDVYGCTSVMHLLYVAQSCACLPLLSLFVQFTQLLQQWKAALSNISNNKQTQATINNSNKL